MFSQSKEDKKFEFGVIAVRNGKVTTYDSIRDFREKEHYTDTVKRTASDVWYAGDFRLLPQKYKKANIPFYIKRNKPVVVYDYSSASIFDGATQANKSLGTKLHPTKTRILSQKNHYLAMRFLKDFDFEAFLDMLESKEQNYTDLFETPTYDNYIILSNSLKFICECRSIRIFLNEHPEYATKKYRYIDSSIEEDNEHFIALRQIEFELLLNMFPSLMRWIVFDFNDELFMKYFKPTDSEAGGHLIKLRIKGWIVQKTCSGRIVEVHKSLKDAVKYLKLVRGFNSKIGERMFCMRRAILSGKPFCDCYWFVIPPEKVDIYKQKKGYVYNE